MSGGDSGKNIVSKGDSSKISENYNSQCGGGSGKTSENYNSEWWRLR